MGFRFSTRAVFTAKRRSSGCFRCDRITIRQGRTGRQGRTSGGADYFFSVRSQQKIRYVGDGSGFDGMTIAVIGAGAVGGYFGGRLALNGNDVVFLVRGKTFEAL